MLVQKPLKLWLQVIGALLQTFPAVVPGNGKAIPRSGRTESVSVSSAAGYSKISRAHKPLQLLINPTFRGMFSVCSSCPRSLRPFAHINLCDHICFHLVFTCEALSLLVRKFKEYESETQPVHTSVQILLSLF